MAKRKDASPATIDAEAVLENRTSEAIALRSHESLVIQRPPDKVLEEARIAAQELRNIIEKNPDKVVFNGKTYLRFEDWQLCGRFWGYSVKEDGDAEPVVMGEVQGFKASAVVLDRDGVIRSRATAFCMNDEEKWSCRPKYAYVYCLKNGGVSIEDPGKDQIIWEPNPKKDGKKRPKKERRLIGTEKVPMFQLASMAQCVPLRAKILTADGFKLWNQTKPGESVLGYDCATDRCYWTPLEAIAVYSQQPTVMIESRSLRTDCTPDHSWAIRLHGSNSRSLIKTNEMMKHGKGFSNAIVMAASAPGGSSEITPREAAIIGWILTDGCIVETPSFKWRIHIDQTKAITAEIRDLVENVCSESTTPAKIRTFPTGKTYRTKESARFWLRQAFTDALFEKAAISNLERDLPALISRLSADARKSMLNAMLRGDGHQVTGENRSGMTRVFGQKEGYVLHCFRLLCALEGLALGLPQVETDGCFDIEGPFIRQTLRANRHCVLRAVKINASGLQDVWCPTTKYGTWVMEQDGQVMITGNTRAAAKALRNVMAWVAVMAGYSSTPAEEMDAGKNEAQEEQSDESTPTEFSGTVVEFEPNVKNTGIGALLLKRLEGKKERQEWFAVENPGIIAVLIKSEGETLRFTASKHASDRPESKGKIYWRVELLHAKGKYNFDDPDSVQQYYKDAETAKAKAATVPVDPEAAHGHSEAKAAAAPRTEIKCDSPTIEAFDAEIEVGKNKKKQIVEWFELTGTVIAVTGIQSTANGAQRMILGIGGLPDYHEVPNGRNNKFECYHKHLFAALQTVKSGSKVTLYYFPDVSGDKSAKPGAVTQYIEDVREVDGRKYEDGVEKTTEVSASTVKADDGLFTRSES
jgi:hypothetical protein